MNLVYKNEFGSVLPIQTLDVTAYDAEGNEIEIPKCDKCSNYKSQVIGKESFMWICTCCVE